MRSEEIVRTRRYKLLLQVTYFERGNAKLSMLKYIFAAPLVFNILVGILTVMAFGVLAWTVGRCWFKRPQNSASLAEIEAEIGNQFNKFQQEMRRNYKKGSFK